MNPPGRSSFSAEDLQYFLHVFFLLTSNYYLFTMAERRGSVEVSIAEAKARLGVSVDGGRTSRRGSTANYEKGGARLSGEQVENIEGGTIAIPVYTDQERKKIMRKIDVRLVPMLGCLYLIAFLDRGNSEY